DVPVIEAIDHLMDGDSGTGRRMRKARRKPQILRDTETLEPDGDLVLEPDSEAPDCVPRPASDLLPIEDDASTAGAKLTGDELEEGALARAVRADQAAQLPASHLEIHAGDRPDAAEPLLEA